MIIITEKFMNTVEQTTQLLTDALLRNASDIHCDPTSHGCRIRMRIDGVITPYCTLPPSVYSGVLARIKTISGLDIAQQRLPQDGRLTFFHEQLQAQFRVHTCATIHGEKLVMRLIRGACQNYSLDELGFLPEQLHIILSLLAHTHGLIIVCGPTGSGKTMTLYAMLAHLMARDLHIITLEDPVEIVIDGLSQLQVQRKQQLDFATLLRASLRQDPDVIMIGEIRDEETAHIAVRAALTGHLVLTSLHTPHAQASLTRLQNMGVAAYDLEECLRAVLAQRLVRIKEGESFNGRTAIFECYQPHSSYVPFETVAKLKVASGITTEQEVKRVL